MPLATALSVFNADAAQCTALIANIHRTDSASIPLFPTRDREQVTVAAFLNLFIAWESFLEEALLEYLMGAATIGGTIPVCFVHPPSKEIARQMIIGTQRYFDFGNHDNFRKIVNIYFQNGYPFETPLAGILSDLNDVRTMRNSCAHITSTTQKSLEALAQRIFGVARAGIDIYQLLVSIHPGPGGNTVMSRYQQQLQIGAQLIATG